MKMESLTCAILPLLRSISSDEMPHRFENCLEFKFSRSKGPGGQNVNKVNTKVTVLFRPVDCGVFSQEQKEWIIKRLAGRIDKEGVLRVASQEYRTQSQNRKAAIGRLVELLCWALEKRKVRKKTKTPYGAKEKRLQAKKRHGLLKKERAARVIED